MQQAAISGDPLKREDQVEDIKRYAFGTKGCLHLRYQNLNWGLKIFDLVSCYCLGTPQEGGFDLEDNHATRSAKPGKGASEGYAFEPLFRLYFYH